MGTKMPGKPLIPDVEFAPIKVGDLLIERLFVLRVIKYNREFTQLVYFNSDLSMDERVRRAQEWCAENSCRFMFLEPRPAIALIHD